MKRQSASEPDGWAALRDAAFQVVLLTRRKEGLWALPTHERDLDAYAPEDTREYRDREKQDFGHASITVSYHALLALGSATGDWPPLLSGEALEILKGCRSTGGGYGSPGSRQYGVEPNAVPRHTATAMLSQLQFSRQAPDDLAIAIEPAARWLLDNRNPKSGWSYSWEKRPALGAQSTASSLCALCLFLDLGRARPVMARRIETAVSEAYQALISQREGPVWDGDGVPPHNQVRDSAFALRLLHLADRSGTLARVKPDDAPTPSRLIADYSLAMVSQGWPARLHAGTISFPAAIAALHLIYEARNPADIPESDLAPVLDAILADWRNGGLGYRLTGWDWQCAALLASHRAGPIAPTRARELVGRCARLRERWKRGELESSDLDHFPAEVRPALTFALTGGLGFPEPPDPGPKDSDPPPQARGSVLGFLRRVDRATEKPVSKIADWGQVIVFAIAIVGLTGGVIGGVLWTGKGKDAPEPPVISPGGTREPASPEPSPPPPPPPPRTECTAEEETTAFGILHNAIKSDLSDYMRMPEEALPMGSECRLSGGRYRIVYRLNVIGSLCDKDVLPYEASYSGAWPVQYGEVKLRRSGPNFKRLRRQKLEMRANPLAIPQCPRD